MIPRYAPTRGARVLSDPSSVPAPEQTRDSTPRRCILLVDDSDDTLQPLARLLKLSGFDVRLAHTAAEAMGHAAGPVPCDLLVSDVGLPGRSGLDLMRDVKKRYGLRGIAVSGYVSEEDVVASRAAGFAQHFAKPIQFGELLAAICALMN